MKPPKEYAKELVEKMYFAQDEDGYHSMSKYRAKQCALIAVDAITENNSVVLNGIRYHSWLNYFEQVKTEIINLK